MATSEMELGKPEQGCFLSATAFMKWHFILCGIGVIGVANVLAQLFAAATSPKVPLVLNDYLLSFFFPQKRFELAYFVGGSALVFVYWALLPVVLGEYGKSIVDSFSRVAGASRLRAAAVLSADFVISSALLILTVLCTLLQDRGKLVGDHVLLNKLLYGICGSILEPLTSLFCFLWVIFFLLPIGVFLLARPLSDRYLRFCHRTSIVIMALVLLQFAHMFKPFVFEPLRMLNEFFDIPSIVYLKPKSEGLLKRWNKQEKSPVMARQAVDAAAFLNTRQLWWPLRKYDVNEKPGESGVNDSSMCIITPASAAAGEFVSMMHAYRNYNYYYDASTSQLCAYDVANVTDTKLFGELAGSPFDSMLSSELYSSSVRGKAKHGKMPLRPDEEQFLLNHSLELHWQILNRWVIHHHNFVLGPVNELALGRRPSEINMQYGFLNSLLVERLLTFFGGITYHAYFKVFFSFYYVYYALFMLLAWYMFRRVEYVLAVSMLSFTGLNMIGYQFLFLGPGGNPLRHFMDLFVMFGIVRYFSGGSIRWLFLSLFFAVAAILNNKEFGIFLLLASAGALLIRMLNGESPNKKQEIAALAVSFVAGALLLCLPLGRDALAKYYMAGLLGFRLKFLPVFALLLGFGACCFILTHFRKAAGGFKYVTMFLLFYSQQLLVYYVWGGVIDHFFIFLPIYALAGASVLKMCADASPAMKTRENGALLLVLSSLFCVYGISVMNYYLDKHAYLKSFRDHKTYEWNLPRAKFISTMNPAYFADSVGLIQKYAQGNGIYMISKYDMFLPFLATKYQAMPFPELGQFLATRKEMNICVDTLKRDRPAFLFVDSNIDRDLSRDIVNSSMPVWGYLNEESRWRVERLALLQSVWGEVKSMYEKADSGGLLDVYRLKQDAPVSGGSAR